MLGRLGNRGFSRLSRPLAPARYGTVVSGPRGDDQLVAGSLKDGGNHFGRRRLFVLAACRPRPGSGGPTVPGRWHHRGGNRRALGRLRKFFVESEGDGLGQVGRRQERFHRSNSRLSWAICNRRSTGAGSVAFQRRAAPVPEPAVPAMMAEYNCSRICSGSSTAGAIRKFQSASRSSWERLRSARYR